MTRRRVCVVTGSRAEFGLLRPVMGAIASHGQLELSVVVAGSHLLPPAETWREVADRFTLADRVPMQTPERTGRVADAIAVGRGIQGFAEVFERSRPDWVVVLGDRIEAFAAASAASVGGFAVAHIHGGDRAEGVADEAMRHAITKLSHLHLAATRESADRIIRMGEPSERVAVTGSPAIDGMDAIEALSEREVRAIIGRSPRCLLLLHPSGLPDADEAAWARAAAEGVGRAFPSGAVAVFAPNHDAGRDALVGAMRDEAARRAWAWIEHLPRERFLGVLKHLRDKSGVVVGNSSAGLIECAAIPVGVVNLGPRQNGRERGPNVVDVDRPVAGAVASAIEKAGRLDLSGRGHPYGDGHASRRIADAIQRLDLGSPGRLRKRNAY